MIADETLNAMLLYFAAELAESSEWPDLSAFTGPVLDAVVADKTVDALTLARVYANLDGAQLRARLEYAGALKIDERAEVTEAIAGFFDLWARLLSAFARPLTKPAAGPRQVVIAERPKLRERDTIFERLHGKIGEKTGGLDLSEGQPTSTSQYAPQVPASFAAPPDLEKLTLQQRMAAAGYAVSTEDSDYADTRARLGAAPPAPPAVKVRVPYPDDGKEKHGTVYIQRPARLAANAPPILRADAADAGPEVPLAPSPPGAEV